MPSPRYRRHTAIALALLAPHLAARSDPTEELGATTITGIAVRHVGDEDDWNLDFDYVYTGEPPGALFLIETPPMPGTTPGPFIRDASKHSAPTPGHHHVQMALQYPGDGMSGQVIVSIVAPPPDGRVLASQRIEQVIKWRTQAERDFDTAYSMIENGNRDLLLQARRIIEGLITRNPQFDDGYVELARIAMKSNWGPEGLHQAETLLDSALRIRPDSVNAKILLGYVFAHQDRFDEATSLFEEAARENPPNVWLWTNWGELLEMQGRPREAEAKYRQALARPLDTKWSHSARGNAYIALLKLVEARSDPDALEALHERRVTDYGGGGCYTAEYALFLLDVRHDAKRAIELARRGLNGACSGRQSREVLGLASYARWAETQGDEAAEALNQARVFLPAGPNTLRLLARDESTMQAARKLIATGEAIDQKDNRGMTALAFALQLDDLEAAERLLALGAGAETPVTEAAIPVALLPVLDGNLDAIALFRRAGVDYSKLRYRGATAIEFANQLGNDQLLDALTGRQRTL